MNICNTYKLHSTATSLIIKKPPPNLGSLPTLASSWVLFSLPTPMFSHAPLSKVTTTLNFLLLISLPFLLSLNNCITKMKLLSPGHRRVSGRQQALSNELLSE